MEGAVAEVDRLAEAFFANEAIPGIAFGLIADGRLAHAAGLGARVVGLDARPDADSVFRIASMTKSFTAAMVLALRDEGRLRLDDPVAIHVPELDGVGLPTTDSPALTIRHLLTMSSGLATDDPWGDRQQGLALDRFADLLGEGFTFAWVPGTHNEYSNLGYGILGRVVTNVAGAEYRDVVRTRLLEPLGMHATGFTADDVPADRLVSGYAHRDEGFVLQPFDGYGALASMGGLFTSVRDLTIWVRGFCEAWPPRDEPEGRHPLSRASRREMQQIARPDDPELTWSSVDVAPQVVAGGYGFGLSMRQDLELGMVVGHSGGYPGFGSHMRWHPASGLGVVALGNATYAPMSRLATDMLSAAVRAEPSRVRHVEPSPALIRARADIERLLDGWDDELAARLFAENVGLDEPIARRRDAVAAIRERHGKLTPDGEAEIDTPATMSWWLRGECGGRVFVEIQLTPQRDPLIQTFDVTSVPEPSERLRVLAAEICDAIGARKGLPDDLPADADLMEALRRRLTVAGALAGSCRLGPPIGGDGKRSSTFRLLGDRLDLDLPLVMDDTDNLTEASLVPLQRSMPPTPS